MVHSNTVFSSCKNLLRLEAHERNIAKIAFDAFTNTEAIHRNDISTNTNVLEPFNRATQTDI